MKGVSLFTNCGAGDFGFAAAGFQFEIMAELVQSRLDVALLNHPRAEGVPGDLRDTWPSVVEGWRRRYRRRRPAIRSFAQREGLDAAAREIAAHPERFGELHGTEHGPIRSGRRNEALRRTEELSRATDAYLPRAKLARENRRDYRDARTALVGAETKMGRLEADLERGAGAAQARLLVREELRAVQPRVRRELEVNEAVGVAAAAPRDQPGPRGGVRARAGA